MPTWSRKKYLTSLRTWDRSLYNTRTQWTLNNLDFNNNTTFLEAGARTWTTIWKGLYVRDLNNKYLICLCLIICWVNLEWNNRRTRQKWVNLLMSRLEKDTISLTKHRLFGMSIWSSFKRIRCNFNKALIKCWNWSFRWTSRWCRNKGGMSRRRRKRWRRSRK